MLISLFGERLTFVLLCVLVLRCAHAHVGTARAWHKIVVGKRLGKRLDKKKRCASISTEFFLAPGDARLFWINNTLNKRHLTHLLDPMLVPIGFAGQRISQANLLLDQSNISTSNKLTYKKQSKIRPEIDTSQ